MKHLLYSLLLLCSSNSMAQTPYEKMDSLSAAIRNMQSAANGLTATGADGFFELTFPEENFNFLISSRLAYHAVYQKTGNQDLLTLTEDIDLSMSVSAETEYISNTLGVVKLWFPEGYLQSKFYMDGRQINAKPDAFLPFYFKRMDSRNKEWDMLHLVVAICNRTKIDKHLLTEETTADMHKTFVWLTANHAYNNIAHFNRFLEQHPASLYAKEVQKAQKDLTETRNKEIQRAKETAEGIKYINKLYAFGKQSYKNYASFGRADSLAAHLLSYYAPADFSPGKYTELKNARPELQERYKWNKAYYMKREQILAYDALVLNANALSQKYQRKLDATVNGTLYLKATLLAGGGIATGVGTVLMITEGEGANLLKYGGAAFGIGLIWTIIQDWSVNKAGRRATEAHKKANELKQQIGPVIDKRNESIGGSPLINVN